jgi:hypothetical protein
MLKLRKEKEEEDNDTAEWAEFEDLDDIGKSKTLSLKILGRVAAAQETNDSVFTSILKLISKTIENDGELIGNDATP